MPDLFGVLAAGHDRIFSLVNELTGGGSDPATGPKGRKAIADRLVRELSRHEVAEEIIFWPLVRERVNGGESMTEVALDQEKAGKRMLHELVHTRPGAGEFETLTHSVAAHLREHITFEQNVVWPKLRLRLGQEECRQLGEEVQQAERRAPTRPHPYVPADPGLLKTVGPAAALLDRARDVLDRG